MKTQFLQLSKLKNLAVLAAAVTFLSVGGISAKADYVDVDLTGWRTYAGFGNPANTEVFLNLGAGATITGFDYNNLSFESINGSWRSEFVLSVNSFDGVTFVDYIDYIPSVDDSSGVFGPASGSWNETDGFGEVPFNLLANGLAWVTIYEGFDDGGAAVQDAIVNSGTLRIHYTAVPEPGTFSLLAIGLLGLMAVQRNRKS